MRAESLGECYPVGTGLDRMSKSLSRRILAIALLGGALFATGCQREPTSARIDPNRYYAVVLTNSSVYFGKLEGLGTPYPVLRDVFYVQSSVNQETKAVNNILIKRGKELHAPDLMILNEKSIVLVEPVGPQSKIAQLIQESKNK